ncbi:MULTISPECIES: DUF1330 domain-containing protein [unclassified Streptomyces]|uniref:DUF1330 domain-containing protein n=1 Tax=unclassified Streptomyces TaxID=2593676 RepID=UPI001C1F9673|nr:MULTISPECIES: DUF1330 domain-containing protein [unclassified Streptomyces]
MHRHQPAGAPRIALPDGLQHQPVVFQVLHGSAAYARAKPLRQTAAETNAVLVAGFGMPPRRA